THSCLFTPSFHGIAASLYLYFMQRSARDSTGAAGRDRFPSTIVNLSVRCTESRPSTGTVHRAAGVRRQNVNRLLNWNLREPPAPLIRPNSELLIRSSGSL